MRILAGRLRAKRKERRKGSLEEPLPESQGQNLALIVLCVPYLLDSGKDTHCL